MVHAKFPSCPHPLRNATLRSLPLLKVETEAAVSCSSSPRVRGHNLEARSGRFNPSTVSAHLGSEARTAAQSDVISYTIACTLRNEHIQSAQHSQTASYHL